MGHKIVDEEKIILIEAFQPFAQYRNLFTFYYAQTYPLPPKSAIIGMIQNATGDYYEPKFWEIKVSIHGGFESVFWNYQNLIKAAKSGITLRKYRGRLVLFNQGLPLYGEPQTSQRSPVPQQELFNGHLFIFLKGPPELIDEAKEALECPSKVLYLGRSEDVIFIRKIYTQEDMEIIHPKPVRFFRLHYPTYIKLKLRESEENKEFPISKDKFPVYFVGTRVEFKNKGKPVQNKAEITKETEREAEFEPVFYAGAGSIITLKDPEKEGDTVTVKISIFKIFRDSKKLVFKIPEGFGWL